MKISLFGKRSQRWVLSLLIPAFAFLDTPLRANPSGGVVVHGQAVINQVNASHLRINQQTQSAIINWAEFSIGAGELTQFVQPNSSASVLNRVTGGNISQIHGALQGNGNVFVINPNGIVIGSSGVIDVGGNAILSTLDIDDQDFLDGGPSRFYGDSTTGVTNFGTISSAGGDVVLLGGFVDNQGQIGAMNGTVALGSGGDILLEQGAGGAQVTVRGASDYTGTGVSNSGDINGAAVEMKAHGNVYALAINNTGIVRASGATRANGRVRLQASGGSSSINLGSTSQVYATRGATGGEVEIASDGGDVAIGGLVNVDGSSSGGEVNVVGRTVSQTAQSVVSANGVTGGGSVAIDAVEDISIAGLVSAEGSMGSGGNAEITGDEIVIEENAQISVDGFSNGGRLRVGGEFQGVDGALREATNTRVGSGASLSADSSYGDAGSVVVWANNDTLFYGDVSASASGFQGDGGLVEVSGKVGLALGGTFAANSVNGESGTVLFDPGTITVGNFGNAGGVNEIEIATINDTLQNGTSVLLMTSGTGSNIVFEDNAVANNAGGSAPGNGVTSALAFNDPDHPRNYSVQWTSDASFGAFAGGAILVNNNIRTSGAGSVNLLAGWGGTEADFEAGGIFAGIFDTVPSSPPGDFSGNTDFVVTSAGNSLIESAFQSYLQLGQFGGTGGFITVGSASLNRHVEVGSRYGNTNLAGSSVLVTASDVNEVGAHAQVGFRDSGAVFGFQNNNAVGDPLRLAIGSSGLLTDDDPLVGIIGNAFGQEVDLNGDGIADGVRAINSGGVQATTFIPYANHLDSSTSGNWWWQQIHEESVLNSRPGYSAANVGGNRPESGAGTAANYADINVIATDGVTVQAGGRNGNSAFIGHGGDSSQGQFDRAERIGNGTSTVVDGTLRSWSQNGALNGSSSTSIARLAPVYGNINVLAGVNSAAGVTFGAGGAVTATVDDSGSVLVSGQQRMSSSNDLTNPESNGGNVGAIAQIGHGGAGQFGQYFGDVRVEADGDIEILAGAQQRSSATIGHNINFYHYWNPTNAADAQIRFFNTIQDFDKIELRRDALFGGGPVEVAALGGSTINGFHGDVTVKAYSGEVYVKGFDTPDAASDTLNQNIPVNGLLTLRNNRYARIGHGGVTQERNQERGIRTGGDASTNGNGLERVTLRVTNTDSQSEHVAQATAGTGINRALTFVTITGDIEVESSSDISVISGNGTRDTAQIGHGGATLADYETSSVIAGDIAINAGGELIITGGGLVDFTGVQENTANPNVQQNPQGINYAMVGHGGYSSGFLGFFGDIDVTTGGDITATGGKYARTFAKIGHQGDRDWGQTGGLFSRTENFIINTSEVTFVAGVTPVERTEVDVTTEVTADKVIRTYSGTGYSGTADVNDLDITTNTANITVTSTGGNILLNHTGEGLAENANQAFNNAGGDAADPKTGTGRSLIDNTYVQIGHGGINTDALRIQNDSFNYGDKVGDVTVESTLGNLTLENGSGTQRWTRLGHGFGQGDNGAFGGNSLILAGDINVTSGGNVIVNAGAADQYGLLANREGVLPPTIADRVGNASEFNSVSIGHGSALNSNGIIVVGDGSDVNGLTATSNITLEAGGNLEVTGGKGFQDSSAQVGHGFGSRLGNANAIRRNGAVDGFEGDITVNVAQDIVLKSGDLAWSLAPNTADIGYSIVGAYAAIGNGGYGVDASSKGDIQIYSGGNLSVTAQQRTEGAPRSGDLIDVNVYAQQNTGISGATGDNVASVFSFAKIGNFSVENEGANGAGNRNDNVVNANQSGDITVVVKNNLSLTGGTTNNEDLAPILGAFAQIGNGGPGIGGDHEGDITVLVGNSLTATGGTISDTSVSGLNNYTMIGHGDRVVDPDRGPTQGGFNANAVFFSEGIGSREGDIVVSVGNSADFTDVLVGHADPFSSIQQTVGTVQVAVSRNNPFFGGGGTLTTASVSNANRSSDTVFASGTGGIEQLEFYMPNRSSNRISADTRLNEDTIGFTVAPANFAGLDGTGSQTTGRADEVYLTPDLWWDNAGIASSNGFGTAGVFPTDASGSQGGSIATVVTPGGFENLTTLTAGALGSSATLYRGGNGVSGTGLYTLYYDSVETVATASVVSPAAVTPIFDPFQFVNFIFGDQYDSFARYRQFLEDEETGQADSIFDSLALYETDSVESEESGSGKLENRLDNLFGKRRNSYSEEELAEEEESRRRRGQGGVGSIGLTFYVFDPGTNRYSSYRVFGTAFEQFYPVN